MDRMWVSLQQYEYIVATINFLWAFPGGEDKLSMHDNDYLPLAIIAV